MKQLRVLPPSLISILLIHPILISSQQASVEITDADCTAWFRNNTFTTSPWLWKSHIANYDYGLFLRENRDLQNLSIPSNEQNITRILELASSNQRKTPNQISYPLAIEYHQVRSRCGASGGTYDWGLVADTLTTWILPIFGLIVSLPWESNRRRHTILMIFRWVGNPFTTLTYIFWNLRVMGRAATMIDLGVSIIPKGMSLSDSQRRGSQAYRAYKFPEGQEGPSLDAPDLDPNTNGVTSEEEDVEALSMVVEHEEHMNIFSETRDSFSILCTMNQFKLSSTLPLSEQTLRKNIITALFLTDITSGKFGLDDTRRNVAAEIRRLRKRGVVPVLASLGWFFFALAISLYAAFGEAGDNATAHNLAIGLLMGWLPVLVSAAIVDRNSVDSEHVAKLLNSLMRRVHPYDVTFTKFVGQGRRRWHYGVAHPILTMLERSPENLRRPVDWRDIALKTISADSDWSEKERERQQERIDYFSKWELFHMFAAWGTIGLCVLGAWYISYNTPTVGLGCRSFSYILFLSVCTLSGLIELGMYPVMYRPVKKKTTGDIIQRAGFRGYIQSKRFRSILNYVLDALDLVSFLVLFIAIFMQTSGGFQFYWCRASLVVKGGGGYVLFDGVQFTKRFFNTDIYWLLGTVIGCISPTLGIAWTMREWLTESFMWSTDLTMARRGLRRVRFWKGFWWAVRFGGRINVRWAKGGVSWRP